MNIVKIAMVAGATVFLAPVANAASILIDDFSVYQQVIDVPKAPDVNSNVEGGIGDLSADRTMSVTTSGGGVEASTFTSTGASGVLPANSLVLANDPGQSSVASLTYNFASAKDLTMGGTNDKFFFEFPGGILSGDVIGTSFTTEVVSGGTSGSYTEFLSPLTSPFTSFNRAEFSLVDFTNVTSLMFTFDSVPSFDGTLNSISVVPLPASALLLLGGLGGFAAFGSSKRRRRTS